MKKIIRCLLVICFAAAMLNTGTAQAEGAVFTDTDGHWAVSSIEKLAAGGYIGGYPDNSFRPDTSISRAEFIVILINCLGIDPADSTADSFTGTSAPWANAHINEAVKRGIIVPGDYPGAFAPNDPILRDEAAAFLVRALGMFPQESFVSFSDNADIEKSIYKGYIKTAVTEGLMSGFDDGQFRPSGFTTRAQASVLFCLFLDKKGMIINPETDNLDVVSINNIDYRIGEAPILLKTSNDTAYTANTVTRHAGRLLINYISNVDPDDIKEITVYNAAYTVGMLEMHDKKMVVTPSSCKLVSIKNEGYTYNAEFTNLYIKNGSNRYYLSDMEIIDHDTVSINGVRYDLGSTKTVVELNEDFYVIEEIITGNRGIEFFLDETAPLALDEVTVSDIESIELDSGELDLRNINDITFVVANRIYHLADITFLDTGSIVLNDREYLPIEVLMLINNSFYEMEEMRINRRGKLEFYCEASGRELVGIDNYYVDAGDVKIIFDGESYDLDRVLVVSKNIIRIGGKQYNIGSTIVFCEYKDEVYNIKEIDWNTGLESVAIDTVEGLDVEEGLKPDRFVFYLDGDIYKEGTAGVEIHVRNVWRGFSLIKIMDTDYYKYSSNRYAFAGSKIRIGANQFQVDNVSWNVSTGVFKVYMLAVDSSESVIIPEKYLFYYEGIVYRENISGVKIYVKSAWRDFALIEFLDEDNFRYSGTTYEIIGFKVRIGDRQFEIDNTTWNSNTGVMKVYLL